MKQLVMIFTAGVAALGWVLMQDTAPASEQSAPSIRVAAGGAKFVRTTKGDTRPGSQRPAKEMPAGVVDLMGAPAKPSSGLDLSDLKNRQRSEAAGIVTQRHGSASLPRHNDVPRMDGMRMD